MEQPLVLLSNRGPATFERDESGELVPRRGGGGLVTALTGLLRQRDALWIASAMTDEDVEVEPRARRARLRGRAGRAHLPDPAGVLGPRRLRPLLQPDREPAAVVHPALPVGPLERARTSGCSRARGVGATATSRSTTTSREAALEEIEDLDEPIVMVHDYHLYTCPGADPARAPGRLPPPLRPHPVDPAGRLARPARGHAHARSSRACSRTTSSASTRAPTATTSCSAAAS